MTLIFLLNFFSRYKYIYIYIYKLKTKKNKKNLLSNLPIAIVTVEISFSTMKIVNNRLRRRINDQWIDDNLIIYIGKYIFVVLIIKL